MYTVYAMHYHNDFTKKPETMRFASLDDIFQYMKKISHNFSTKQGTWFPTRKCSWHTGYDWCRRIECQNEDDRLYSDFWIHQIDSENGTVYSDGKYTKGERFCSKTVEDWLICCADYYRNNKPKFVEE